MKKQAFFSVVCVLFLGSIVLVSSCKHDPILPENYYSDTPIFTGDCNPDTIYYNRDIAPILNSNCATSKCHDAATAEDGVDLSSYSQVIKTADVVPYNAPESDLIEVLRKTGEDQMPPPPSNHLPDEVIELLEKWINQGALNLECEDVNEVCDSLNMSYANDVSKILLISCVGCHSAPSPAGGIDLASYPTVKAQVDNGKLIGSITHNSGYVPMPDGGGKLDDCSISKISNWVLEGAPNN